MYVDGTFEVVCSAITKGGIIFADAQSFGHILEPNAFKHKRFVLRRPPHPFENFLRTIQRRSS
ncbi:MAG: hypothetical protein ACTS6P_00845 [Candidatus Hodgkinia cicadicola]